MRLFRDWASDAPDEVTGIVNLTSAPPLPPIPEAWHGKPVAAFVACSVGPVDEAEALVREFRTVAEPIVDLLGPMPYNVIQTLLDPLWGKGTQAYFKATNLSGLDDALIEKLAEVHLQVPGPQAEIHIHQMGGALARVPEGATSFSERSMPFVLNAVTGWHDEAQADAHIAWARAVVDAAAEPRRGARTSTTSAIPGRGGARTARRPTSASPRSSASTTRRTSSGSTRTSSRKEPGGGAGGPLRRPPAQIPPLDLSVTRMWRNW